LVSEKPVVLVTGASRGIGRALAACFAKKKYRVGINFLSSEEKARAVEKEVNSLGGEAMLLKADIGNSAEVKEMTQALLKKWGRLDVLVCNAGISRDRTILKMSDAEWEEVLKVNLNGVFWCIRESARAMTRQKNGSIISIASMIGVRGGVGCANYAASKSGVIGLTKAAARELGRFNIRVNAILPGFHATDLGEAVWKKYGKSILAEHVLGRLPDLGELSEFVLHIAEQKSASGQVFNFESRII